MCDVAERLENKGRTEGRIEGKKAGLKVLVRTLTPLLPTFQDLIYAIRKNEEYKDVT